MAGPGLAHCAQYWPPRWVAPRRSLSTCSSHFCTAADQAAGTVLRRDRSAFPPPFLGSPGMPGGFFQNRTVSAQPACAFESPQPYHRRLSGPQWLCSGTWVLAQRLPQSGFGLTGCQSGRCHFVTHRPSVPPRGGTVVYQEVSPGRGLSQHARPPTSHSVCRAIRRQCLDIRRLHQGNAPGVIR